MILLAVALLVGQTNQAFNMMPEPLPTNLVRRVVVPNTNRIPVTNILWFSNKYKFPLSWKLERSTNGGKDWNVFTNFVQSDTTNLWTTNDGKPGAYIFRLNIVP